MTFLTTQTCLVNLVHLRREVLCDSYKYRRSVRKAVDSLDSSLAVGRLAQQLSAVIIAQGTSQDLAGRCG